MEDIMFRQENLSRLVAISLVSEKPKQIVASSLKLSEPTLDAFIDWLAAEVNADRSVAKKLIANSPVLLKIAFILA